MPQRGRSSCLTHCRQKSKHEIVQTVTKNILRAWTATTTRATKFEAELTISQQLLSVGLRAIARVNRRDRVAESLGKVYKCHYPAQPVETARGVKKSAIYDRLKARNAYFREVSGWEGADFYAPTPEEATVGTLTWGRHHWFPYWEREHRACREGVVLVDMSFMSKFLVQGRDAGALLNRLSTANVDGASGEITYTQWLNEAGKMEADLTVAKLDDEKCVPACCRCCKLRWPRDSHAWCGAGTWLWQLTRRTDTWRRG